MASYIRTHNNGALSRKEVGEKVTLAGWVHRRRDHGGLIFIDLRDRFGITQIVFKPEDNPRVHEIASQLRGEWVIAIQGKVVPRSPGMVNPKLKTGEIEIEAHEIEILSKAKTPPFSIVDETLTVNEELRLQYRYLDMRRGEILKRLRARHTLMLATRNYMDGRGFTEVTTPILGKATPEGARDYLVPSRIYPGQFYALPQSPQLFKQLLMIGGLDRYFQIAPCFRDEDLRADRQPEFMQIDIEMSFATSAQLFEIVEGLVAQLFQSVGLEVFPPFRQMTYKEATEKYGTDKPDLRFGMSFCRVTDLVKESSFSLLKEEIEKGAIVKGFCVKGGADISRKTIDDYSAFVGKFGSSGLAWIKIQEEGAVSSITKFFPEPLLKRVVERFEGEKGDLVLFVAGPEKRVNQSLDHLRRRIAAERGMITPHLYAFTWVTDFPLFQWDEETRALACEHHPFTSPHLEDVALIESDPLQARSSSYDLVLNGYEIASGSQRIHDSALQEKIFKLLKLSEEETRKRFGFFIEALSFGTPPHIGIALGFDRLSMIVTQTESIRDVIAFPKTQKAADLMLGAPSEVVQQQLTELKIHIEPTNEG